MIRLSDTYVRYPSGVQALNGVSLNVAEGEFVFLVGPSGAGKSTFLKLLTGELRPSAGLALVNSFSIGRLKKRSLPKLRRTLGVVYQDFRLIDRMNVFDNVAFAMRVIGIGDRRKIRKRVLYVLGLVGLAEKAERMPNELSGGEQQRVAIARALVNNPGIIIADEPTGNLDPERSRELMGLLARINELGTTVIVITHEQELVNSFGKRVVSLDAGQIVGDTADTPGRPHPTEREE